LRRRVLAGPRMAQAMCGNHTGSAESALNLASVFANQPVKSVGEVPVIASVNGAVVSLRYYREARENHEGKRPELHQNEGSSGLP
jgi:hypothetical protein